MVKESMDLLELLRKRGVDGDVDFLLEALRVVADAAMNADVSAKIGAEHGERSPDRQTCRNGCRSRHWDTRVGTMEYPCLAAMFLFYLPVVGRARRTFLILGKHRYCL